MKKLYLLQLLCLFFFIGCDSKEKDEHYSRPDWLGGTLYEEISKKPDYQFYSEALRITGYSEVLGRTGSYTLFAPTDQAFAEFLTNYNNSLENVPSELLEQIVAYSIVNFPLTRDILTARSEWGYWSKSDFTAYRKETYSQMPAYTYMAMQVVNQPKYIPIFTKEYFVSSGVSGSEQQTYSYLFPNTTWDKNGFSVNVQDANVVSIQNPAENGFYYGVDKVLMPLDNIAEVLATTSDANMMNSLFAEFTDYVYNESKTVSSQSPVPLYEKKMTGVRPVELASPTFDFEIDINEEKIGTSYSAQAPMYSAHTIFVPSNTALQAHIAKYDGQPSRVALRHLLSNHFIKNKPFYPVQLCKEGNPYKYLFDNNLISGSKLASNGLIYYTTEVVEPEAFRSVTAPLFFKSKYLKYLYALEKVDQTLQLADGTTKFQLLVFDNQTLDDLGIDYDASTDVFLKNGERWADPTNAKASSKDSVRMMVERHIVKGVSMGGYGKTLAGDYVFIDKENNVVISDGKSVNIKESYDALNGTGSMLSVDAFLPKQQANDLFLKANYPKFYNLLSRLGIVFLYDEYTAFAIPDALINYGVAPFDMMNTNGSINTAVADAAIRLQEIINYHMVTRPLFTSDQNVYGSVRTRGGYSFTFNGSTITDGGGNVVNISAVNRNMTKGNGVVIHEVDKIMNHN